MRYIVSGISMNTGEPASLCLDAGSEAEARELASEERIAVARVEAVSGSPAQSHPARPIGRWLATFSAVTSALVVVGTLGFLAADWLAGQRALLADQQAIIGGQQASLQAAAEERDALTLELDAATSSLLLARADAAATKAQLEARLATLTEQLDELRFPAESFVLTRDTHATGFVPIDSGSKLYVELVRTAINDGPWLYSTTLTRYDDGTVLNASLTEQETRDLSAALAHFAAETPGRPRLVTTEALYMSDASARPRFLASIELAGHQKGYYIAVDGHRVKVTDFAELREALDAVLLNMDLLHRSPDALSELVDWGS